MKYKFLLILLPIIYLIFLLLKQDQALTQDLGRHIKTGEIILNCKCVPNTNLFSYTSSDFSFINHHWLSEVVFYSLSKYFGLNFLLIIKFLVVLTSFLLIYYLALKKGGFFWVIFLSFVYLNIFSERFDSRPEIFSFLFISLFIFLIEKYRQKRNIKYLIFLPLIELLWTNMHIYFIVGIVFFSFLVFEELIKYKKKIDKKILLLFLLTILSTFINPNSLNGALIPFTIFNNYGCPIMENQNIVTLNKYIPNVRINLFEIMSTFLFVALFINIKKIGTFPFLVILFGIFSSFYMVRNFPIFVLSTLLYSSVCFYNWEDKIKNKSKELNILLKIFLVLMLFLFVIIDAENRHSSLLFGFSYIKGTEKGADFFLNNNLKGPIFNNFDVGGYLIYRLYPKEKVFIDGRPEAYPISFCKNYEKIQSDDKLFTKTLADYKVNIIFFDNYDFSWIKRTLKSSLINWKMVYIDQYSVVFLKDTSQNKAIIDKFKIDL